MDHLGSIPAKPLVALCPIPPPISTSYKTTIGGADLNAALSYSPTTPPIAVPALQLDLHLLLVLDLQLTVIFY